MTAAGNHKPFHIHTHEASRSRIPNPGHRYLLDQLKQKPRAALPRHGMLHPLLFVVHASTRRTWRLVYPPSNARTGGPPTPYAPGPRPRYNHKPQRPSTQGQRRRTSPYRRAMPSVVHTNPVLLKSMLVVVSRSPPEVLPARTQDSVR